MSTQITRNLFAADFAVETLVDDLRTWFDGQHMRLDVLEPEEPGSTTGELVRLIASSRFGWRKMTGLGVAVALRIEYEDPSLKVAVVAGYDDQTLAFGVGVLGIIALPVLAPLAGTALVGARRQQLLPERCLELIQTHVESENRRSQERGHRTSGSPREMTDDYAVMIADNTRVVSAIDDSELVLSDFEVDRDEAVTSTKNPGFEVPCDICFETARAGAPVCPQGHRMP